MKNKMQVEIWSDIMCPFCYIGKRKFDKALEQFDNKDAIEVIWKSYQLIPDFKPDHTQTVSHELSSINYGGMSKTQMDGLIHQVTAAAASVGLEYHLDKSIPANTFKAHQFLHFSKLKGKQNEAEEAIFKAYFTDIKNVDDISTLVELGRELGLNENDLKESLENESHKQNVIEDIYEGRQIGVSGVPFFVFDRKQAISGAQDAQTFLSCLEQNYVEWEKSNPKNQLDIISGQSCSPDSGCN